MRVIGTLLVGGGAIYLALLVIVYLLQSRMLYFPNLPGRSLDATPGDAGLEYEDVAITTADGVTLHGWHIPAAASRGTVLFFHGNAGNISHRLDSIALFHRLGLDVLIPEYRGYGQSEGRPSEAGTYRDAEAAWKWLTQARGVPPDRIAVFGRSLGGSIAAWLAAEHTPAGLMVESSFVSVPELAAGLYPFLPARLLSRFSYDTAAYLGRRVCPVLVVHSRHDEIIPFEHGQRLFEAAREPRQFLEILGSHNDGFLMSGQLYRDGVEAFFDQILPRDPPRLTDGE